MERLEAPPPRLRTCTDLAGRGTPPGSAFRPPFPVLTGSVHPKPRPSSAKAPPRPPEFRPALGSLRLWTVFRPRHPSSSSSSALTAAELRNPAPPRTRHPLPTGHCRALRPSGTGFRGRHDGCRVLWLRLHRLRARALPLRLHHRHRPFASHLPHRRVRLSRVPDAAGSLPFLGSHDPGIPIFQRLQLVGPSKG